MVTKDYYERFLIKYWSKLPVKHLSVLDKHHEIKKNLKSTQGSIKFACNTSGNTELYSHLIYNYCSFLVGAVLYYYFYKRTALRLGDPRFYKDSQWLREEFARTH